MEKAAFDYLGRYMATSQMLRQVLERRVRRAAMSGPVDEVLAETTISELVAKCAEMGLVDDRKFAEAKAASLARRGDGSRSIMAKLIQKGVDRDTARAALIRIADETSGNLELASAVRLAERRRLGPYRHRDRGPTRDRDLAAMARAGHSLTTARMVIDAASPADLEALVDAHKREV